VGEAIAPALVRLVLIGSAVLFVLAWWQRDALPPAAALTESAFAEPEQRATDRAPFQATVGGITYTVRPLFSYDLAGLVVSKHDADAWWDWIHAAGNDKLNVTDLCVVWGANAKSGVYRRMRFSSGEFVCYAEAGSREVAAEFDPASLSNNHLLTDDPAIARVLKIARVGDQVRFRGYLAEYTHDHGFHFFRGTSVTRTDQGNGACETVFATDAEILRRGNTVWRALFWLSPCAFVAALVAWIALPFRAKG
jgi:hypothetical protein